jgi:hypothetical protein
MISVSIDKSSEVFAALPLYELFLFSAIYVEGDSCGGEDRDGEGDGAQRRQQN